MTAMDWLVVAVYAAAVLAIGLASSGRTETHDDYFLAGRKEGWASVAASTWATKLSALTFIGVPGAAISGNFAYAQLWVGSFLAAYAVAAIFIPAYYRLRVSTVYEFLEIGLGRRSRLSGTAIFIVSRCLASAVRLAGCAIAVSVFFDVELNTAIALIAAVAAAYVLTGGLRAVIWTDVFQLVLFLFGAAAAIVYVGGQLPGGFAQIVEAGSAADKFRVFDFKLDATSATTFWTGNLFAFVLGLATGAADQDIAQRALACTDQAKARQAVISAGVADLVSTLLFLCVGVAVFSYYQANASEAVAGLAASGKFDYIFPYFIRHELPAGLRGLLVVALLAAAMSSLDSALSGLASSAYFDLGLTRNTDTDRILAGPRLLVIAFAAVLAAIAAWFGAQPSILWFGLKIMGYTYGGLLGLFLIAAFLRSYAQDAASAIAAISSIPLVVLATHLEWAIFPFPWPWAVVTGVTWTCASAVLLSAWMRGGANAAQS